MAEKRRAFFSRHRDNAERRAFVKRQDAKLKALKRALAQCASKPAPAPSPPLPVAGLYIAVGDSIAVGVGASSRDNGFVAVYFARLRASGLAQQLSNRAVSGATATTVLANQLPSALEDIARASDTKLVSVTVGTNDSADVACRPAGAPNCPFASNLRTIIERLQGALATDPGDERIQIMDRYNFDAGTSLESFRAVDLLGTDGRVSCGDTGWNDVIHCIAVEKVATVVDTYTPMLAGGRPYLADGVHPNDAGHAALAQAFDQARGTP